MIKAKKTVDELRGSEILQLKKDLGLSKRDPITALQIVEGAKGTRGKVKYPELHNSFQWDDTKAAYEFRLEQARKIIRGVIFVTPENNRIRRYTSLKSDQATPEGGYRETIVVMNNKSMRKQLLIQAWEDFDRWREKYESLKELVPVFKIAETVKTQRIEG